MTAVQTCPICGKPVPESALNGICPVCLLRAGAAADTGEVGPNGTLVVKAPMTAPLAPAEIASHFPQLDIIACLGRGGMGVVYKARQPQLNRLVALKILAPEKESDPKFAERFTREAQALARLNHPNIVTVHDFGVADGLYFLLMEFVDGTSLRELLRAGKMKPEEALAVVPKICEALQFAHERGIVHRDIKPENVLLDKEGRVKIADFGIAKIVGREGTPTNLTEDKQVVGTPHYMAPEQVEKPQLVDHRADIYSLGVVFYEMLTGELPLGKFQPPSGKAPVDARLDGVVMHALEKEPERRYQHASEVKTDVETIAATPETCGRQAEAFAARDAVWLSMLVLPELLLGERIVYSKKRLWAVLNKSLPTYRLFFALPLLWETGLYITDRRILLVARYFGLAQHFSIWFPGKAPDAQHELLKEVSTGESRVLGPYLQLRSEDFKKRWWRSPELRLRLYVRKPELLRQEIEAARSLSSSNEGRARVRSRDHGLQGEPLETVSPLTPLIGEGVQGATVWVTAARWTARIFSTLLLAFYGFFVLAEGLPPIGSQPAGVQLNFIALGIMLAGFIVGWKREGTAALLIASGWTLWQVAESSVRWNLFQTPLPVAALYAFCWWATRGHRTMRLVATTVVLAAIFVMGRLICPANVFISGAVIDATTGEPVSAAELRCPRAGQRVDTEHVPNARSARNGRFNLYVGWYSPNKPLAISAPGFETLHTNLGSRPLGERRLTRNFQLVPASSPAQRAVPPVVVGTIPESGAANVDASLTELRIIFNTPMENGGASLVAMEDAAYPETTGPPRFLDDGRTCVLPVKLQPGKVYALWVNRDEARGFRDRSGQPAVPYLLVFETRK